MTAFQTLGVTLRKLVRLAVKGFFQFTHSGFALLGLAVAFVVIALMARPELRQFGEEQLVGWLKERELNFIGMKVEADSIDRATATDPQDLPRQQSQVAFWLSRKYRVAPEPLSALVVEAYDIGQRHRLDPALILAVMAVESNFNPFAQSPVGAQGLMQVMTSVHTDKYEHFGGRLAAFDPVTNLRVGAKVLQDCISRAGSIEAGLKQYVGANSSDDGGYASKVLVEQERIRQVAQGRKVPFNTAAAPAEPQLPAASQTSVALLELHD